MSILPCVCLQAFRRLTVPTRRRSRAADVPLTCRSAPLTTLPNRWRGRPNLAHPRSHRVMFWVHIGGGCSSFRGRDTVRRLGGRRTIWVLLARTVDRRYSVRSVGQSEWQARPNNPTLCSAAPLMTKYKDVTKLLRDSRRRTSSYISATSLWNFSGPLLTCGTTGTEDVPRAPPSEGHANP